MDKLSYLEFRNLVESKKQWENVVYTSLRNNYSLYFKAGDFSFNCIASGEDLTDFENNYKSKCNSDNYIKKDFDIDGREFRRIAITNKGWAFLAHFIECESSKLDSIYCEDHNGNRENQHYCKFYNDQGNELITQQEIDSSCVKSVFTIKPQIDYEIVCGEIHHHVRPISDFRVHSVFGVIDTNGNQISVKPFVKNLNMKFKDTNKTIQTDGRSPKLLNKTIEGIPYDANQIQIIVYHEIGFKHEFMIELEYYRQ